MKESILILAIIIWSLIINDVVVQPKIERDRKVEPIQLDTIQIDTIKELPYIKVRRTSTIANDFNNPACIRKGNPKIDALAIGYCNTINGNFLVFPDPQRGLMGLQIWIKEHKELTLQRAINIFAPHFENDTKGYISNLCKFLNCKPSTRLNEINEMKLMSSIAKIEGFGD